MELGVTKWNKKMQFFLYPKFSENWNIGNTHQELEHVAPTELYFSVSRVLGKELVSGHSYYFLKSYTVFGHAYEGENQV